MIFLEKLNENERFISGDYYRIKKDKEIEIRHKNKNNKEVPDTILTINPNKMIIDEKEVYICTVTYLNLEEWTFNFDEDITDQGCKNSHDILVQFDMENLFKDKKYYTFFMEKLLEEKRVLRYLEEGNKTNPKRKCGDYIGYIDYDEQGELGKYFNIKIGEKCHYLPEKVRERQRKIKFELNLYNEQLKQQQEIKRIEKELLKKIMHNNCEKRSK